MELPVRFTDDQRAMAWILLIIHGFGLCMNTVLIYVAARYRKFLSSRSNVAMVPLLFADLSLQLANFPIHLMNLLYDGWRGTGMPVCEIMGFFTMFGCTFSVFGIVILAYERYETIIHGLPNGPRGNRSTYFVACSFVFSLLSSASPFIIGTGFEVMRYEACLLHVQIYMARGRYSMFCYRFSLVAFIASCPCQPFMILIHIEPIQTPQVS